MATAITYPNGQTLTSSALTLAGYNTALQALVSAMLGALADAQSAVRLDWQTEGQPAPLITDDVCYIQNIVLDDPYNRVRDKSGQYNDGVTVTETWTYTRVWQTTFVFYGPNGLDRARLVKSGLYLDFAQEVLAAANLSLIPDMPDPLRAPELFQGQWWERVQFAVSLNEGVAETINTPAIFATEIVIGTDAGQTAVINHQPLGYGLGYFDSGNYGF